ncbi:MAG: T9SS type A sorting domain-containing protein, partial [Flavobacterium sp.]
SYTWNGTTYTTSGNYTYSSINNHGCTNVATLHLTIKNSSTSEETEVACDSYTWNGTTYTTSGNYTYSSTNSVGCTNVATLHLTINNSSTSDETQVACDSYTWNGTTYTTSGDYTYSSINSSGCTNVATLHLTINNSTTTEETKIACDSYTWNGTTYTSSGDYTYTSTNSFGCTSVATLHLTIKSTPEITLQPVSVPICEFPGAIATLTVGSSSSNPIYNWYSQAVGSTNWTLLSDDTNYQGTGTTSLVITRGTDLSPSSGTKYKVEVFDSGCTSLPSDEIVLQETYRSRIASIQPYPLLSPAWKTCYGTQVTFQLSAGSVGNIQWQSSTNNIDWVNEGSIVNQTALNAQNPALYFTTGVLTQDLWIRIIASNGICSSVISTPAKLTVSQLSSVGTLSPVDNTICKGSGTTINLDSSQGDIRWWRAPVTNGVVGAYSWFAVNQNTISTGNLNVTTAYKAIVTNGGCPPVTSSVVIISVNPPSFANNISGAGTICSGQSKTLTLVSGSVGSIQWQSNVSSSTTAPSANDSNWANIQGATNPSTYTASPTTTTWYRVVATNSPCSSIASVAVRILVNQASSVGTLSSSDSTVCIGSGTTLTLSSSQGTITWWKAPVTNGVVGTFAQIGGTTNVISTGAINVTTAYKAVTTSSVSSPSTSNTVIVQVQLKPKATVVSIVGTLTPTLTTCQGSTINLSLATGSIGNIQWMYSTNNGSTWTQFSSYSQSTSSATNGVLTAISPTLSAGIAWFKIIASNGVCTPVESTILKITVSTPSVAGTISALNNTVCSGTGTTINLTGSVGTVKWQKAIDPYTTWSNVTTGSTMNTGNITTSTAYRAIVTNGACSQATSNQVVVNVLAKPLSKGITANTTSPSGSTSTTPICTNSSSKILSVTAGYIGTIQWQKSTDNVTYSNISGENTTNYTISNPAIGANYFRVAFTNSCGASVYSNVITVYYKNCATPTSKTVEKIEPTPFGVVAAPIPFSEKLTLNLTTSSEDKVKVMVYDMVGKLVDQREVSPTDASTLEIGDQFPSGVYNLIVTQGDNTKVIRVIKR